MQEQTAKKPQGAAFYRAFATIPRKNEKKAREWGNKSKGEFHKLLCRLGGGTETKMTQGIICEYNPMHRGHEYMIRELRRGGADTVVCVMSGNFVQRGDVAILEKYSRAEAAVRSGADLVFELPFPWSTASAGYFAGAGVFLLHSLGVRRIAFGSETASMELLRSAAEAAVVAEREAAEAAAAASDESPARARGRKKAAATKTAEITESDCTVAAYEVANNTAPARGLRYGDNDISRGYAADYYSKIAIRLGTDAARLSPNDILGIEYIRAAIELGLDSDVSFTAIRREGASFHDNDPTAKMPSATAMRAAIFRGEYPAGLTDPSVHMCTRAAEAGIAPASLDNISSAVLYRFRMGGKDLGKFAECGGGVSGRLVHAAMSAGDIPDMLSLAATKKYTTSRLRRAIIFAMCGVMPQDLKMQPAYTTLLASSERGRAYLAETRKTRTIPVMVRPADAAALERPAEVRQLTLSRAAEALYSLALPRPRAAEDFMRHSPFCM